MPSHIQATIDMISRANHGHFATLSFKIASVGFCGQVALQALPDSDEAHPVHQNTVEIHRD